MTGLSRSTALLQEGSLYVLLFLLPFSKAAIEITFGLLLLGWCMERFDPTARRDSVWTAPASRPLLFALVAYVALCALSIVVSDHRWLSLRGFISKWCEYLLLFVIVADLSKRPGVMERSLVALSWSSVCVVVQGVVQELFLHRTTWSHPVFQYQRMVGPYENPIDLATYLMVLIPILWAYAITRRGIWQYVLWGLLLSLGWCLARTHALGAWLGLLVALLMIGGTWAGMMRWYRWMSVAAVGVATATLWIYRDGMTHFLGSLSDIGIRDRWVMWQAAMGMIRDRPVLGHGLNTFMANYLDYWVGGEYMPRYAHNCYLQVAAETGLLGLAAFLTLLIVLFVRLLKRTHRSSGDQQVLLCGLTVGLLAFALQAALDTNFYSLRQAALFWTLSGVAVGLSVPATETPRR
jgi:putative inorganic carbon (HCO3(-)) transporter